MLNIGTCTQSNGKEIKNKEKCQVLMAQESRLSFKQLQELHHVFGHPKVDRLDILIKAADKETQETKMSLNKIKSMC